MPYDYSNKTLFELDSDTERYIWTAWNLLIVTASFIGDSVILVGSIKFKAFELHKVIVTVIQHIAVCDLMLSAMILQRTVVLAKGSDQLWVGMCYVKAYLGGYTMTASVFLVCTMTLSKHLLLKYPLRTGAVTAKQAHKLCAVMWTIALYFPITFLITDMHDVSFTYRIYDCAYNFSSQAWKWLKPISSLLLGFLPNITIIVTTILLLLESRKVARGAGQSLRWQGIMTVVLTAAVYSLSILPLTVYYLVEPYVEERPGNPGPFYTDFFRLSSAFLNLNVIANFFIYSFTVRSFRRFIRTKVTKIVPCLSNSSTKNGQSSRGMVPKIRTINRTARTRQEATTNKPGTLEKTLH